MNRGDPKVTIELVDSDQGDEILDLDNRLMGFEYIDRDNGQDRCVIFLRNDDYHFFDDYRFVRGQKLRVRWGYFGNLTEPEDVVIKKVKGLHRLQITARSLETRFDQKVRVRSWENKTYSEIVEDIAVKNEFKGKYAHIQEPTGIVHDCVNQNMTDSRFLSWMAHQSGFVFYIDRTGLHFHERKWNATPLRTLWYDTDPNRGDIIEFYPESDLSRAVGSITIRSKDPQTGEIVSFKANNSNVARPGFGDAWEAGDPETASGQIAKRNATHIVRNMPGLTKERCKQEAKRRFKQANSIKLKYRIKTIGNIKVRAKTTLELRGVGKFLEGNCYVKESRHMISGGYTTSASIIRDSLLALPVETEKSKAAINTEEAPDTERLKAEEVWVEGPDGELIKTVQFRSGEEVIPGEETQHGGTFPRL